MKRILYILFIVCCQLSKITAQDSIPTGILFQKSDISLNNDSVHFNLIINANHFKVSPVRQLILTPVLKYGDKWEDLPPVIIMGARRAAYARREEALGEELYRVYPYAILIKEHRKKTTPISYNIGVPYVPLMNHAQLWLRQTSKDCCNERFLSLNKLSSDIALQDIPQTIPDQPTHLAPVALPGGFIVSYLTPQTETIKKRNVCDTAYIDYRQNIYAVEPGFANNRHELKKISDLLSPLLTDGMSTIKSMHITGYASPEGSYADNEILARRRSQGFAEYLYETYPIKRNTIDISWVPEDWDGLTDLLNVSQKDYKEKALHIIRNHDIFHGREKILMELDGGKPYHSMLAELFPKLRRIVLYIGYEVRRVTDTEASDLVYERPQQLSLDEIFRVARFFKSGTPAYREIYEIAARQYPDNIIANVNAGAASLIAGDIQAARSYLDKVKTDPRAFNDLGVLSMLEGKQNEARAYFEKALQTEPEIAERNLKLLKSLR